MADIPSPLGSATPSVAAEPSSPLSPQELANAVLEANRFLTRFAGLQQFKDAELTVVDWTIMMALSEKKDVRTPQLVWLSGIAEQRIGRILDSLVEAGLIVKEKTDARPHSTLILTDAGKVKLKTLNEALRSLMVDTLSNNQTCLTSIRNGLFHLIRIAPA